MLSAILGLFRFLLEIAFTVGLYFLWFRIAARYVGISPEQPIAKFVIRWTDYLIQPLTPILGKWSRNRVEVSAIIVVFLLHLVRFYLFAWLIDEIWLKFYIALIVTVGDCFIYPLQLLFYAFVLRVVMGWVSVSENNPTQEVVKALTAPIMAYSRNWVLPIDGMDFLPYIWVLLLKCLAFIIAISMPFRL